jgi:hypothetical protein
VGLFKLISQRIDQLAQGGQLSRLYARLTG